MHSQIQENRAHRSHALMLKDLEVLDDMVATLQTQRKAELDAAVQTITAAVEAGGDLMELAKTDDYQVYLACATMVAPELRAEFAKIQAPKPPPEPKPTERQRQAIGRQNAMRLFVQSRHAIKGVLDGFAELNSGVDGEPQADDAELKTIIQQIPQAIKTIALAVQNLIKRANLVGVQLTPMQMRFGELLKPYVAKVWPLQSEKQVVAMLDDLTRLVDRLEAFAKKDKAVFLLHDSSFVVQAMLADAKASAQAIVTLEVANA